MTWDDPTKELNIILLWFFFFFLEKIFHLLQNSMFLVTFLNNIFNFKLPRALCYNVIILLLNTLVLFHEYKLSKDF